MEIIRRKKNRNQPETTIGTEVADLSEAEAAGIVQNSPLNAGDFEGGESRPSDDETIEKRSNVSVRLQGEAHWFELLPAIFFTAFTMMVVRGHLYYRPMDMFYWTNASTGEELSDYYAFYKMISILICASLAIVILLYKGRKGTLQIKNSFVYLPVCLYVAFVLLSYGMSQFKEFALLGMNDRFEGTLSLLGYMIMLFYIMNIVNSEKSVRRILYAVFISVFILGLIGITQSIGRDFNQTEFALKLTSPLSEWQYIDNIDLTRHTGNRVYQTVYNSNYVSFYLSLFLPVLTMVYLSEQELKKKILLAASFALAMYNFIYSQSSGGLMGLGAAAIVAFIILNKKLLQWKKPIAVLLLIVLVLGFFTFDLYAPEVKDAFLGVLKNPDPASTDERVSPVSDSDNLAENSAPDDTGIAATSGRRPVIDYIETKESSVDFSFNGEILTIRLLPEETALQNNLAFIDHTGSPLAATYDGEEQVFRIEDERYHDYPITIREKNEETFMIQLDVPDAQWIFEKSPDTKTRFLNRFMYLLPLRPTPSIGWEDNPDFGSGRGYIWSRTLPLLKNRVFFGYGADTYAIYFPQDDYAGKYSIGWSWDTMYSIIDKPHSMYLGIFVGTGGISLLALLTLWGYYIVQSLRIYRKSNFEHFLEFTGCGIFLGVCGFLVSALVNDSTVGVMPLFYGLLGVGITTNMMLKDTNAIVIEPESSESQFDPNDCSEVESLAGPIGSENADAPVFQDHSRDSES